MNGSNIAGGNPKNGRAENDYYATNPSDTKEFLELIDKEYRLDGSKIIEPAAGEGHIVNVLKSRYPHSKIISRDLVDRGIDEIESGVDFLSDNREEHYDFTITNPPFNIAKDFIDRSLQISDVAFIFAKLQFLEGVSRKPWFANVPLKYVYVYSHRANPWRNGKSTDENGKKWSSTMAFAWYVFDQSYDGEPIVRWI